jgi:DNA-3-methyladenine glycosylase II
VLSEDALREHAKRLAAQEPAFRQIMDQVGPPPLWARPPGFATLVWIILEQQVSLASARAAYERLGALCPQLTPQAFLEIDDTALRQAGFSRQKTTYCRNLAQAVQSQKLDLESLSTQEDSQVRQALLQLKGIGPWTADIYLLLALRRADIWPLQDRALAVAVQRAWQLSRLPGPDELEGIGEPWRPYRSTAARLLWHFYLSKNQAEWILPLDKRQTRATL